MARFKKKTYSAHRLSWVLHNGPIEGALVVRHLCDNPHCCNPHHLELGTQRDNYFDIPEEKRNEMHRKSGETFKARGHKGHGGWNKGMKRD